MNIQVRDADRGDLEEFFRFGGPSVFSCGCSAHDAVQIGLDDVGTAAYPIGDGLDRSDIEEFCEAIGAQPVLWWHDCPKTENVVVRSPIEAG